MFRWLASGLASIAGGFASIMSACAGTSRFNDYDHLMPRGRKTKIMTLKEAQEADAKALRTDWKDLGQWRDIGSWYELGKVPGSSGKSDGQ
ncbi:MAG: hypothetical protein RSD49_06720 [Hafnia sp.]